MGDQVDAKDGPDRPDADLGQFKAAGGKLMMFNGTADPGVPFQSSLEYYERVVQAQTPGFIVEATAFHDRWRAANGTATPSREEIGAALSGHLCRCGAYDGIFSAVAAACASGRRAGSDAGPGDRRAAACASGTGTGEAPTNGRNDTAIGGNKVASPWAKRHHCS